MLKNYHKFVLFTCAFAFIVLGLGAYTRLSDSGLGCPDWPGCYGILGTPDTDVEIQQAKILFPESNIDIKTTKMSDVMTKNPFVLSSDILAYNAVSLIQEKKITSIIVTKEKKVIGALNIHDLFRAGLM